MDWSMFPRRLREARTSRNLKQSDLAGKINTSVQTISAYETGSKRPTIDNAVDLASALNVPLSWLLALPEAKQTNRIDNLADAVSVLEKLQDRTLSELGIDEIESVDGMYDASITRGGATYYLESDGQSVKQQLEYFKSNPMRETESGFVPNPSVNFEAQPVLMIMEPELVTFFVGRQKMQELLATGVINQGIYDSWHNGKMSELREIACFNTVREEDHGE